MEKEKKKLKLSRKRVVVSRTFLKLPPLTSEARKFWNGGQFCFCLLGGDESLKTEARRKNN